MRDGARRDGEEEEEQGKLGAATERLSNGKRNGLVGSRSAAEIKSLEAEAARLGYKITTKAKPGITAEPKLAVLRREAREGGYELVPADAKMLNSHDGMALDFKPGAGTLGSTKGKEAAKEVETKGEEEKKEGKGLVKSAGEDAGSGAAPRKEESRVGKKGGKFGKVEGMLGEKVGKKEGKKEPEPPMGLEGASLLDSIGRWLYLASKSY